MEEDLISSQSGSELSSLAQQIGQIDLRDQLTGILRSSQGDLEKRIFEYLDNIFPKITKEQQIYLGMPQYYQSDHWFLVPQHLAKELLLCFTGNRIKIEEHYGFAIAGRLLEESGNSEHPFTIWSNHEQAEPLFIIEIKIPENDKGIQPKNLYFGKMRRDELCSNKYNLYILRPKRPAPKGSIEKKDIFLVSAIDIQDKLLKQEPFSSIENLKEMIDHNKQVENPKYLYTSDYCKSIKERISSVPLNRQYTFEDTADSNNRRNVLENVICFSQKVEEEKNSTDQQDAVLNNQLERNEREEQSSSVDQYGRHFLLGNIRAQNPENSSQNLRLYEPSGFTSTVTHQSLASCSTASTGTESMSINRL